MRQANRAVGLGLAAFMPAIAQAADDHGGGGMPQLRFDDPMLLAQVVWLLVIFGVLYVTMSAYALPRVASVLAERRARIDGDLEIARAAKDRADAAMAEHRAATAQARAEAQAAVSMAVAQAQDAAAKRSEALNARLSIQIEAAEGQIAQARDAAMGAIRQVAAETADALVHRLTGLADRAAIDQAVDMELAARGRI